MFDRTTLYVAAYTPGVTSWHYHTSEKIEALTEPGFFDGGADLIGSGDHVAISAEDGCAVGFFTRFRQRVMLTIMCSASAPAVQS